MPALPSVDLPPEPDFRLLRVAQKKEVAQGVFWFELRDPEGAELPAFAAGAHVTVQVPAGQRRSYSLCGDPSLLDRYEIAVKRDAQGRGGSISMTDDVQAGDLVAVSLPANHFALSTKGSQFIFVAGGIGITPLLAMARHLATSGQGRFRLYYCTRDVATTAFAAELQDLSHAGTVKIHHDHGDPAQALDLWPLFEKPSPAHVYCCGPRGLMDAVRDMTGHWPGSQIHFESFGVASHDQASNQAFTVHLQRTGTKLSVSAQQTLLEALRQHGLRVASSCESGTCGSCRTGLIAGEVEHRDMVLSEPERASQIMVCVSRGRGGELVLDL